MMSELTPELLPAGASGRALAALTLAGSLFALWGCAPELPPGRFGCQLDSDCPGGWTCAENASGARRCYPEGSDWNAIHRKDGSAPDPRPNDGGELIESGPSNTDATTGTVGNPPPEKKPAPPAAGSGGAPAAGSGNSGSPAAGSGGTTSAAGAGGTTTPPNPNCVPDAPDAERGVFVAPNGSLASDCGSATDPCSTILQGMDRAEVLSRTTLYLASGTYEEPLTLRAGLTVRGGYERSGDSWMRSCDGDRATRTRIESSTEVGAWAEYTGIAEIETLTISTLAKAPMGHSTYGVFARGTDTQLTLREVEVYAASGGDGQTGNSGATPAPRTGSCSPSSDGAAGATDGLPGTGAATGMIDSSGYVPGDGLPGEPGLGGHNGTAGLSTCRACLESCDPTTCSGTAAGQSCGIPGISGCGGAPAAGGGGGGGGGSSFGIFAWGARVTVIGGVLQTGNGGRGGAGGNPGNGGAGSDGAPGTNGASCTVCVGTKGPITPPPPSPDGTEVQANEIAAAGKIAVIPLDGGVIVPISCSAGKGSGVGTAGGRGGSGSRGGVGGGGAGGNSYGAWAGGQGQLEVSSSTRIQIGEAGNSQSSGAKGESVPTKNSI
jgi:hypothetical protein